jgi:hypothetical protein
MASFLAFHKPHTERDILLPHELGGQIASNNELHSTKPHNGNIEDIKGNGTNKLKSGGKDGINGSNGMYNCFK